MVASDTRKVLALFSVSFQLWSIHTTATLIFIAFGHMPLLNIILIFSNHKLPFIETQSPPTQQRNVSKLGAYTFTTPKWCYYKLSVLIDCQDLKWGSLQGISFFYLPCSEQLHIGCIWTSQQTCLSMTDTTSMCCHNHELSFLHNSCAEIQYRHLSNR